MADVEFKDYTLKVIDAMNDNINAVLEECAGELESQTKRNSRVDTGKTKNSFKHMVVDSEHVAYIGSNDENAIWEEFGTGEYALKGNGRRGGWHYKDDEGKWHHTYGKTPTRALHNAFITKKNAIIRRFEQIMREKLGG